MCFIKSFFYKTRELARKGLKLGGDDAARRSDDYQARINQFRSDQKERIGPKLEQLNLYLHGLGSAELIMLSSNGYELKLIGGRDLSSKIEFELIFLAVSKARLNKAFHLKILPQSIQLQGYIDDSMIINLSDDNGTKHSIECGGFEYKIIEEDSQSPFLEPSLKEVEKKVEAVNHYLANTNINDYRVVFYDGHMLSLVASFDLCYYHEIELTFLDLVAMDLDFYSGAGFLYEDKPFLSLEKAAGDKLKFIFSPDGDNKNYIICGDFDYKIELVKYFDNKGRRKMDIKY